VTMLVWFDFSLRLEHPAHAIFVIFSVCSLHSLAQMLTETALQFGIAASW